MNATSNDKLTGLPGRVAFEGILSAAMAESGPVTVALVDVDHFARHNKELGHEGGDAILKAVAAGLSAMPGATVLRYGGDEFAAVFPGLEREQAFLRLEKAREALSATASISAAGRDIRVKLSVSAGVAAAPIDGSTEAELLRKADGALYRAKLGGRNKVMLAFEERMAPKTSHFTVTQLERLSELAKDQGVGEAVLLREALDDLLVKHLHAFRTMDELLDKHLHGVDKEA